MKSLILFAPEFRCNTKLVDGIKNVSSKYGLDFEPIYVKKEIDARQQQLFLLAVHICDIVVVDCTIPPDITDGGVYPSLTAQVNILNHVIVVSENNLPLNITPYRGVFPEKDGERYSVDKIIKELPTQIECSLKNDTYGRISWDMKDDFLKYQKEMEIMLGESLKIRDKEKNNETTSVMISYRNCHNKDVESFKSIIIGTDKTSKDERSKLGCNGKYSIKVLPPASLCGAFEAHTPMRRWMLVGLLEDHIKEVDEVWIYESYNDNDEIDYTDSWWTIAEIIMVAYHNYSCERKIKIRVYNPKEQTFYAKTPSKYVVTITEDQHKQLARLLSNTRPDTMGPECMSQVKQLKKMAMLLRFSAKETKRQILDNLQSNFEMSVPQTISTEERKELINEMMKLYSDPDEIERYANDDIFKEAFWNEISYQTDVTTHCFENGVIDVDKFLSIPMDETTGHNIQDFIITSTKDGKINLGSWLHPSYFKVSKASDDRYLWLASRMGKASVKGDNAPGLEKIPIYNITRLSSL